MSEPRLRPVEELILAGVAERFQQVFNCLCAITNTYEKIKAVQQLFDGRPVQYPYALISVRSVEQNVNSYQTNYISRRGLQAVIHDSLDAAYTVRLMPTIIDLEIEFHTDQFDLGLDRSALSYAKSWLFARRLGYMKFNAEYGRLVLGISADLDSNIILPSRENMAEGETVYKVESTMRIFGYMSQAELGTVGIVQNLVQTDTVSDPVPQPVTIETSTQVWALPSNMRTQW